MSTHPIALSSSSQVSRPARVSLCEGGLCCGRRFRLNWELISQVVNLVVCAAGLMFRLIKSGQSVIEASIVFAAKQIFLCIGCRLAEPFMELFFSSSTQQNFMAQFGLLEEDTSTSSIDSSEEDTSSSSECSSDEDTSTSSTDSSEEGPPCIQTCVMIPYGNSVCVISDHDVVSFSTAYSKETGDFYRTKGYSGICTPFLGDLSTLICKQNYVEVLKCVWTEEDLDRAIDFLEVYAKEKRPILMLELSRTICRKMVLQGQFSAENYKEAWKWFVLGLIHTKLDLMCMRSSSTNKAFKTLISAYHPRNMISESDEKAFFAENEEFKKSLEALSTELRLDDVLYPCPEWLAYHGWINNSLHPEAQWEGIRLRGIQYLKVCPLRMW